MKKLYTTLGPLIEKDIKWILPHEHTFVDLRHPSTPGFGVADPDLFLDTVKPAILDVMNQDLSLLIDCAPLGVGRRVDLIKKLSEACAFPIMVPTGIYREPWIPEWATRASVDEIAEWMIGELTDEVEGTGIKAGFIKISATDDGMTPLEERILRAACKASLATGSVIGSHTIKGQVVMDQVKVIEEMSLNLNRFIWIHAHLEEDFDLNLAMARKGMWIEYDGIGWGDDSTILNRLLMMREAGFIHQVLISQDHGWFEPEHGAKSIIRPYTYLKDSFIPKLRQGGFDQDLVDRLIGLNPFEAFSRD